MADARQCPNCSAEIPADSSDGLCRECLLRLALREPACLHVRCPHCHNQVELLDDSPIADIECPSCGSNFSMVSAETATYAVSRTKTIAHFELLERVGMGHFGTVWKARDTQLDRIVAIKIPRKEQLDAAETEQFMREARAAAQVTHSNIVSVHEVGREDNCVYIVSDFVEGASLAEWLTGQRLTPNEAADLCRKIAEALHEAHEAGVVHRDLKPGNIMLDREGEPYLTDFGLAKRNAGEITMTIEGRILGTPAYMSPEQAGGEGHTADRRSDIYSLGVILFQLLTGELPFRGETRMLIVQVLRDEPPRPRRLNNRIPRDLETVCLKCLEKSPARRYSTAKEVANDLRRYLSGESVSARPVGRLRRLLRWSKRNPTVASLTAAVFFLLAAATTVSTHFAVRETAARHEIEKQKAAVDEANDELHTQLYVNRIRLAHKYIQDDAADRADILLDSCPTNLRHWEWHYLKRLCHPELMTIEGLAGHAAVAFSPDGNWIATGSQDSTIAIRDAQNGRPIHVLHGHTGGVKGLVFSPDSKWIVSASGDKTLRIWNTETGQTIHTLEGHTKPVHCVAVSTDGQWVASGSEDNTVKIWDTNTGKELRTLKGHRAPVQGVSVNPAGHIASASRDGSIRIWNAITGDPLRRIWVGYQVFDVAFSPDGTRVASAEHHSFCVQVWDVTTGEHIFTIKAHILRVTNVEFSPDGKWIASGSHDGNLKIWDANTGAQLAKMRYPSDVHGIAFSPDGRRVAACGPGSREIRIWDPTHTAEECMTIDTDASRIAVGPNGRLIATVTPLRIWDAYTGEKIFEIEHLKGVCVAFSDDGERVAGVSSDRTVRVCDARSGKEMAVLRGQTGNLTSMSFSADSNWIASTSEAGTVCIWDASSGTLLKKWEASCRLASSAFSPTGQHFATTTQTSLEIWDTQTWNKSHSLPRTGYDGAVVFSPDGTRVAVGDPRTIRVFDVATGDLLVSNVGHSQEVTDIVFSSDGKRMVSGSLDKTVRFWDAATGQQLLEFDFPAKWGIHVGISPDGKWIAGGRPGSNALKIWHTSPLEKEPRFGAKVLAIVGNWREAAQDRRDHLSESSGDEWGWWSLAALELLAGEFDSYEETCRKAFERFAQSHEWAQTRLVIACSLASQCGVDRTVLTELTQPTASNGLKKLANGMNHYRCGRFEEAIRALPEGGDELQAPLSLFFRAMAHHHLEETDKARGFLVRGMEAADSSLPTIEGPQLAKHLPERWIVWCMIDVVRREAKETILPANPDHPKARQEIAAFERELEAQRLLNGNDLAAAVEQWTKALAEQPENVVILRNRGEIYVRQGKWEEAADDFAKLARSEPTNVRIWLQAAPVVALAGNKDAMRQLCLDMLAQLPGESDFSEHNILAKVCLLMPDAVEVSKIPLEALEKALDDGLSSSSWDWAARALAEYRRGNASKALDYIAEVEGTPAYDENSRLRALSLSVKALAQLALQQPDAAVHTLGEASDIVEEGLSKVREGKESAWHDVLIAHILCLEARTQLEGTDEE